MGSLVRFGLVAVVLSAGCAQGGEDPPNTTPDAPVAAECNPACSSPSVCCEVGEANYCLDVSMDMNNCGGCGEVCNAQKANQCAGGHCMCGFASECGEGFECCSGEGCKNLQTDKNNCGRCGNECGPGQTCTAGQCTCGGTQCTGSNNSCCGGSCTNTQTDEANCGQCGRQCTGEMSECNVGDCTCPGGGAACPTTPSGINPVVVPMCCAGAGCVDVCGDAANCGGCGQICELAPGIPGVCVMGSCNMQGEPNMACMGLPDMDGGLFPDLDAMLP